MQEEAQNERCRTKKDSRNRNAAYKKIAHTICFQEMCARMAIIGIVLTTAGSLHPDAEFIGAHIKPAMLARSEPYLLCQTRVAFHFSWHKQNWTTGQKTIIRGDCASRGYITSYLQREYQA